MPLLANPKVMQPVADEDKQVWCGHMPCIGASNKGCECHSFKDPDAFYNPLLPPNAPLRLQYIGDQPQIVEASSSNTEKTQTTRTSDNVASALTNRSRSANPNQNGVFGKLQQLFSHDSSLPTYDEATKAKTETGDKADAAATLRNTHKDSSPPPLFSSVAKLELASSPGISYYPGQNPKASSAWERLDIESSGGRAVPITDLPFDKGSYGTLAPIHPNMPYYLAFYHLDWARRGLKQQGLLDSTSVFQVCRGESTTSQKSPSYAWSSELYYMKTFYQKQEITYRVHGKCTGPKDLHITMCPHITVSLSILKLKDKEDGLTASAHITYSPARYKHDAGIFWKSSTGRMGELYNCTTCWCDLEQILEIQGNDLHVRFTAWRDLGEGIDRFDPKWNALLTGKGAVVKRHARYREGKRNDYPNTYSVYRPAWSVARATRRPNTHVVTFNTAHGSFTGLPDEWPTRERRR